MNICVCLVKISWIYCFLFRLCSRLLHKDVEANPDMFPKRCYSRVLLMTPTWQFTEFGGELSFTPWSHVRQGYTFLYPVLTLEIGACRDSVAWLWQVHLRASVVFPFNVLFLLFLGVTCWLPGTLTLAVLAVSLGLSNILPHSCLCTVGSERSGFRFQSCYSFFMC